MHRNAPAAALLRDDVADVEGARDATLRVENHRPVEAGDLAGAQAGLDRQQDHDAVAGGNGERATRRSIRFSMGGVTTLACLPGMGAFSLVVRGVRDRAPSM